MPATYDLPRINAMWDVQDVNRYQKLPFYLALQQAKFYPTWNVYNKLVGTTPWQPNMGSIMRGVITEPSPIGRAFFFPNNITETPKKDVFSQYERTNEARIKRHLYESPQFHFLPSFQDFRKKQIQMAQKDIGQQIMAGNDIFIRSVLFHYSPYVYVSGKGVDANGYAELVPAAYGDGNDAGTSGKSIAFLQDMVSKVGNAKGNLSLKTIAKAGSIMREDLQIPPFEGMVNVPKDNETIRGRYVLVGGNDAYSMLTFDDHVLQYKELNRDLINDEFRGVLLGYIAYKVERFPIRIADDGTVPVPQLYEANPNVFNAYETVPNPAWVNAKFEVAFMMGGGGYDSINVGPPPTEFASGKMSEDKFNKLFWNGEVKITDNVLINFGNNVFDTNKYGEVLQLISSTVHGIIPVNRRAVLPIIFRRWRVEAN